jgi:hypothetical protein
VSVTKTQGVSVNPVSRKGDGYQGIDWSLLVRCLSYLLPHRESVPFREYPNDMPIFREAIENACRLGAVPFEVIAGTPKARYGARITFRLPSDPSLFVRGFGLEDHAWGSPDWVGFRSRNDGSLGMKAYHQSVKLDALSFQEKLRGRLDFVMASLDGDSTETYWRLRGACQWPDFAQTCLEGFQGSKPAFNFQPAPEPVPDTFCVSEKRAGGNVQSVSLFADYRALPDDTTISRLWTQDLPEHERKAYELALAALRSTGQRQRGTWHGMLSWTLECDGVWHKAASLLFPVPS